MSVYANVRTSKLKLKGAAPAKPSLSGADKKRKRKQTGPKIDEDAIKHGGWWKVKEFQEITGPIAIEVFPYTFILAKDDGTFTFGAPHNEGEGPSPEEVLTAIRVSDSRIALKSGYGKYLGITSNGKIVGRAEAIGSLEQWEPVFEEGKLALAAANQCFLTCKNEEEVMATSTTAGLDEVITIRSVSERVVKKGDADEEEEDASKTELHYVKKFQCFQDKKIRINPGDVKALDAAKKEGNMYETLLDRREKMKSDRMCK
ncbi:Protein FRG1 [Hypsibius exemplaris]|uniref:Protein FRG1 homolog n=1 Tax=Hypsibius exemplaris TaxID=2072580 RepID=A0A1W0X3S0_HYPEX|nr:Protein FRG1 [Hypsibius exemplaris]